ncbi:MAG: hypothetical protein OXG82_19610 [Gammaproteobacteria bacterium]|nr:hypothetical protein [Gammaproteobacteria bacterium]
MNVRPEAQLAAIQGTLASLETAVADLRMEIEELKRRAAEADRRWQLLRSFDSYRELHARLADTGEV